MARSHPPTLLKLSRRALFEECRVSLEDRLLVAVSGGMDSMALLHVLSRLVPGRLVAHGVDHGLRPEASAELDLVEAFAHELDVPFARTRVRVSPGGNLQHRARVSRYQALSAAAERCGATCIATAHHADDRAETVLLRLLRGSGPRGLAVLPARAEQRIRPFIRAARSDIALHVVRHRIPYAEDPSNRDKRFLRARVRHELLPLLRELSPQIVRHLTQLADVLLREASGSTSPAQLSRAHIEQIYRALNLRRPGARVRIAAGFEISIERRKRATADKMTPEILETDESGGAKPPKRG